MMEGGEYLVEFIINPNSIAQSSCTDYSGGSCPAYKACPNVGICGNKQHCTEVYYIVATCPANK